MIAQIILYDQCRSASHLLQRILSKQPKLQLLYSNYSNCRGTQVGWLLSDDWEKGMSSAVRSQFEQQVRDSNEAWRKAFAEAQSEGKTLLLHDHPFSAGDPDLILDFIKDPIRNRPPPGKNFTLIPDALHLQPSTVPILTIRDPRLAVPSAFRVLGAFGLAHGSGRPNFTLSTSAAWQRTLHDFFSAHGIEPLVIDADDLMTDAEAVCRLLAARLGLDPEALYLEWQPPSEEERMALDPSFYASQRNLIESLGPMPERAGRNVDLQAEEQSWKEFGEMDAAMVKEMAELAGDDYRWLYERRLRV